MALNRPLPQLEFSTPKLDLGEGKPNEILQGELTLTNRGDTPAKFSLIKHCGCTELSPLAGELASGASKTIHVGLQLAGHANSEKNTSIEVKAIALARPDSALASAFQTGGVGPTRAEFRKDEVKSELAQAGPIVARCVVSARCPAPFQVTPGFISFGSLTAQDLPGAVVELQIDSGDGQPPVEPESLVIKHSDDAFEAKLATVSVRGDRTAAPIILRVRLNGDVAPGDHWDTLELRLAASEHLVRVPLNVSIVEGISVVPATVSLRKERGSQTIQPVQLLVQCRAGRDEVGKISLAEGPSGVQIDDLGEASRGRRLIRLSVNGDIAGWPDKSDVWLQAEGADVPFGFKVSKPSS